MPGTLIPRRAAPLCACLSLLLAAGAAAAQVRLDRYAAPATPNDGLVLDRPLALGHKSIGGLLAIDYADDPLVLELERGLSETETARLVDHQLQGHASLAYGLFDRLVLNFGLDFALMMAGDSFDDAVSGTTIAPADGAGAGDARLGARYVALGTAESLAALAIDTQVTLPLAQGANSEQSLSGEKNATVHPELIGEVRPGDGVFRITLNAGLRLREDTELLGTRVRDELTFGLGAAAPLPGRLRALEVLAELYGSTAVGDVLGRDSTPLEALVGARFQPSERWRFSLAAGPGIRRGVGSPDMRALASVGFVVMPELDADNDAIPADMDACPSEAEDKDGFEDADGCPDADNDADAVSDEADRCPAEAEDRDGFEDADGCPDADNDADAVSDDADRCPAEAEDKDGFEDTDGCPDPDNDADGVLDADDQCPLAAGTAAEHGCAAVRVQDGQIRIPERIEFGVSAANLLPESTPLLQQIHQLLEQNPQIRQVAVEGHTDSRGPLAVNQSLSEQRARAVVDWLVASGIAADRLTAWGCGPSRPLADEATADGLKQNRRVELHVVDPEPAELHPTAGCQPAGKRGN